VSDEHPSTAEIRRLDALAAAETRRVDGLLASQDKAVTAALAAAEKAVAAALVAAEKAVDKAEVAQQRVNETQNEFRGTLKDQAATLMPRAEAELAFTAMRELVDAQAHLIGELRSRIDIGPPSLATLQARSDSGIGGSQAIQQGWKYVLALGSLLLGLIGLYLATQR